MKTLLQNQLAQVVHDFVQQAGWSELKNTPVSLERPKQEEHGDFACNVAMVLAAQLKNTSPQNPRQLAEALATRFVDASDFIGSAEVAGPGFINIRIAAGAWQQALGQLDHPHHLRPDLGRGKKILLEYVSANPTGPLHVGNARGGPLGDCLARVLAQCGYEVTSEYYVNDIGGQVDRLGQSILHWMQVAAGRSSELPEGAYEGEYVRELAREAETHPERNYLAENPEAAAAQLAEWGVRRLLDEIRQDCEAMGSTFDRWVHEKDLRSEVEAILSRLTQAGKTQEADGALWFVPTAGTEQESGRNIEDRDSVLRRSNAEPTYFADDIVCHVRRLQEGFDQIIDVWGSNHHGHVPRLQSALAALGYDPSVLEVVLYQYVRVCRGQETVKMSKRAGNYVTAREVLEEVGPDAMRFFLLQRAPSAHLDFDLELAKKQSNENPVFYIQYAHARICSVQAKAAEHGLEPLDFADINALLLDLPEELQLIQFLFEYQETLTKVVHDRSPHHLAYYLLELARRFHNYYAQAKSDPRYRVLSESVDRSQAKLYFLRIIKSVLADGLSLLGLTAPEEMRAPPDE